MKYLGLILTLAFANTVAAKPQSDGASRSPNIIVFMADDMGYADAGFTGSQDILTPILDELAVVGTKHLRDEDT